MDSEILRTTMGKGYPTSMKVGQMPAPRPGLWDFIRGVLPQDQRVNTQTPVAAYMGIRG